MCTKCNFNLRRMNRILVIDQSRVMRHSLKERLEHEGYCVDVMESYDCSQPVVSTMIYNTILCDDITIDSAVKNNARASVDVKVIVLSDFEGDNTLSSLMALGVYGVVPRKPFDMGKLRDTLAQSKLDTACPLSVPKRACKKSRIIVGESEAIEKVRWIIDKVAPIDVRVLIQGANGTGKELVAHQLHTKSTRVNSSFVEVNCAAIPSELIESELFGHEKGAFTTAVKTRKGKFEQADGGTLFLDEIGDMSLSAQAKVLRVLQEGKISRVGSDKDISVDVRVIAATNKDLIYEIANGNFREDLYHRLSVVVIFVPTLNQRIGDIPLLSKYFMNSLCQRYTIPAKEFDDKALDALCKRNWTGNIRELRNVIERFVIFSGERVTEDDVVKYSNKLV